MRHHRPFIPLFLYPAQVQSAAVKLSFKSLTSLSDQVLDVLVDSLAAFSWVLLPPTRVPTFAYCRDLSPTPLETDAPAHAMAAPPPAFAVAAGAAKDQLSCPPCHVPKPMASAPIDVFEFTSATSGSDDDDNNGSDDGSGASLPGR